MVHHYIKREIPSEISENGGAMVVLVDKNTVPLETSIDEAVDGLYVIGDKLLIKGDFVGLFESMIAGVQRDGHARQLGDFITVFPVVTGPFDLDTGWDPTKNAVKIRVRLLNEMEIDISDWEFVDVTPGRVAIKLESVKGGDVLGVVRPAEAIEINGKEIPLSGKIRVDWEVKGTDLAGTLDTATYTSTCSRIDIAKGTLQALNTEENDGKTIVFTVRGNCAKATISAVLKYAEPLIFITNAASAGQPDGTIKVLANTNFTGAGFRALKPGERLTVVGSDDDYADIVVSDDGKTMTARAGDYDLGAQTIVWYAADGSILAQFNVTVVA